MVQLTKKSKDANDFRIKKRIPKSKQVCVTKAQYEQKKFKCNSKNGFEGFEDLSKFFKVLKNKFIKESFVISLSGGSDSLALVALAKAYRKKYQSTTF